MIFAISAMQQSGTAYTRHASSLITTGAALSQIITSPQSRAQVAAAGGTAGYSMGLVNLYNQDYPDYGLSEATLTTSSPSAAATHRTFGLVEAMLVDALALRQRGPAVPALDRIVATFAGDSGPIPYQGKHKRALGGLAVLALVVAWAGRAAGGRWPRQAARGRHGRRLRAVSSAGY